MRHLSSVLCLTALVLAQSCGPPSSSRHGAESGSPQQAASAPVPASLQHQIAASEYHIHHQDEVHALQSPNRAQGMRFTYHADGFEVRPRAGHATAWAAELHLTALRRGAKRALPQNKAPQDLQDNHLVVHHPGFDIEYLNDKEGMRQNFIVMNRLPGDDPLRVEMQVDAKGLELACDGRRLLGKAGDKTVWEYRDLRAWDAAHQAVEAHMELTGETLALVVEDKDAQYPITVDPLSALPVTSLESNQVTAQLGWSVSSAGDVNGDGYSDLLVGAPLYDNGQIDEGVVMVHHGSQNGISAVPTLMLEANMANAHFGHSLSNAGDLNGDGYGDVVIGAVNYSNGESIEGGFYTFHGSPVGLSSVPARLVESNQANAQLGKSCALAGDINADGYSDILVGAYGYSNGQPGEGAVFVYHGSATGIGAVHNALLEQNQAMANYGWSVAGAGDVNGDGYSDVIVGADNYSLGEVNEGVAFVYHGSAAGIVTAPATTLQANQADAAFGFSVTSAGDVNGDGYSDVAVGAPVYDNGELDEGAVFVYHGSAGGASTASAVMLERNQADAQLGHDVALAGDINGDGFPELMMSAVAYSNGEVGEGAVWLHAGSATGLSTTPLAQLEANQAGAWMGASVASAGDVNGDGYSDIVAGASLFTNGELNEGLALVWHGSAGTVPQVPHQILEENQIGADFGTVVSTAGDINADGYDDVVIGARNFDNGQNNEGAVFVYMGGPNGLNTTFALRLESNQADAYMGNDVAAAGDVNGDGYDDVILAAYTYDNPEIQEGRVYIHLGSAAGLAAAPATILEVNQTTANFGFSVCGAGDLNADGYADVAASAYLMDNGQTDEGLVFVYYGSAAGIATTASVVLESNLAFYRMGNSVGSAGDVNGDGFSDLAVSCMRWSNPETQEGCVMVFHGSTSGIGTTPSLILESNQANASMGSSVGSPGDVNGDGYWDLFSGCFNCDFGETDEGAVLVWHGSALGIVSTPATIFGSNQSMAHMGYRVSPAGDVNGDGYADLVCGAEHYVATYTNEGTGYLHLGSPTGISPTPAVTLYGEQAGAWFGKAVGGAGDVNGDGFSDILLSSPNYDNPEVQEGQVRVYFGNIGIGKHGRVNLYNTSLTPMINVANLTDTQFGAGIWHKPYQGRMRIKAAWETQPQESGFAVAGTLGSYTGFTDQQAAWTLTGLVPAELKAVIAKEVSIPFNPDVTKVRMRIRYDQATMLTGQVFSPWRYMPGYFSGENIHNNHPIYTTGVLPLEGLEFSGTLTEEGVLLQWAYAYEARRYTVERGTDGTHFTALLEQPADLRSQYDAVDAHPAQVNYYRLRVTQPDGSTALSEVVKVALPWQDGLHLWPIPAHDVVHVEGLAPLRCITLMDAQGRVVQRMECNASAQEISVVGMAPGSYLLKVEMEGKTVVRKLTVQ